MKYSTFNLREENKVRSTYYRTYHCCDAGDARATESQPRTMYDSCNVEEEKKSKIYIVRYLPLLRDRWCSCYWIYGETIYRAYNVREEKKRRIRCFVLTAVARPVVLLGLSDTRRGIARGR